MKAAYPIIIYRDTFVVYVPDFDVSTEGVDVEDCMEMAREAIGLTGISLEDIGKEIPKPSYELPALDKSENAIVTFVDVDFAYYRKLEDNKMVKRNCTIPAYLNALGEKAGLNFSEVLRTALTERLL